MVWNRREFPTHYHQMANQTATDWSLELPSRDNKRHSIACGTTIAKPLRVSILSFSAIVNSRPHRQTENEMVNSIAVRFFFAFLSAKSDKKKLSAKHFFRQILERDRSTSERVSGRVRECVTCDFFRFFECLCLDPTKSNDCRFKCHSLLSLGRFFSPHFLHFYIVHFVLRLFLSPVVRPFHFITIYRAFTST